VFLSGKPLFLGGSYQFAVVHQSSSAIVIESRDPQKPHVHLEKRVDQRSERARFGHDEHHSKKKCCDQKRQEPELLAAGKKTPKLR
jgi:hypothetical protein